jgi:hypothetical protein
LSWYIFPFWLFFLVSLYLYFVPPFQAGRLLWPFIATMILAFVEPPGWIFLIVFLILFYYLLLVKDLLVIDRHAAFEILTLALSFLLLRDFYRAFGGGLNGWEIWYAFLLAALLGILVSRFMAAFSEADPEAKHPTRRIVSWMAFLIGWQFVILGIFLPLDFIYQSAIIFLIFACLVDFTVGEYLGDISRSKALATGITIFAVLAIVLASAHWGL